MYREKILALYKQHNPDKVSDVDRLLEKYAGNEERLYLNIKKKYIGQVKEKIIAVYEKHNPDKLKDVDRLMTKFAGNEVKLLAAITERYAKLIIAEKKEEKNQEKNAPPEFPKIKTMTIKRMKPHVLKDRLEERGLSLQGTKKELMDRLIQWQEKTYS